MTRKAQVGDIWMYDWEDGGRAKYLILSIEHTKKGPSYSLHSLKDNKRYDNYSLGVEIEERPDNVWRFIV
jgi:hypothetical protein